MEYLYGPKIGCYIPSYDTYPSQYSSVIIQDSKISLSVQTDTTQLGKGFILDWSLDVQII